MSAPAIYAHFADTDAILLAVAERLFTDLATRLQAALDQRAADGSEQRLRTLCGSYLRYAETHPNRYLVMFGGQWDARTAVDRGAVDAGPVLALGQDVLTVITIAVDASATSDSAPAASAVSVWVLLHGYAHQRIVSSAFPWPPAMTDRVIDGAVLLSR